MKLSGIDISHHNWGVIQAEERRTRGWLYEKAVDGFVIMKATEGISFDDPRFLDYIRMIGESNILGGFASAGAYHYARPENNTAYAEAKHFVDRIRPYAGKILLALDVEGRALAVKEIDKWCLEWLRTVEDLTGGVKPVLYVQRSALSLFESVPEADFGLWLASWQKVAPKHSNMLLWPFMALWQNNGLGVDTDIFFGNKKQWNAYCSGGK